MARTASSRNRRKFIDNKVAQSYVVAYFWRCHYVYRRANKKVQAKVGCIDIFIALAVLGLIILACFFPLYYEEEEYRTLAYKIAKYLVIVFIITIGFRTVIPTQTEVAAIYLVPKIVNNESVQKIPESLSKLLEVKLNQWIEESIEEN